MITAGISAALAQLRQGVEAVLAVPVEGPAAREWASLIESVEVHRRRLVSA